MTETLKTKDQFNTLEQIVKEIAATERCYCDLDRWEPQRDTWHSWVCPIHKKAKSIFAAERSRAARFLEAGGGLP